MAGRVLDMRTRRPVDEQEDDDWATKLENAIAVLGIAAGKLTDNLLRAEAREAAAGLVEIRAELPPQGRMWVARQDSGQTLA